MLDVVFSTRFKKDLKLAKKRGYDLDLLDKVVVKLQKRESLEPNNHDHDLIGDFMGFRECHILPDWLLIYRVNENELFLFLSRTGTHADLF
ncbi:MAG: type II toxin-antitoxin system YafQ family toxin [Lachnospiraceae bacterium]|nr:type II toxin-antitoxin system YafQ family toxin [Lachnospiraceae bacterium]